ncbi:MAG: zinc ABC transporter substrate-binding protein [Rhodobacterales bacterium]|nr:MAG: zinc ABC transporter substrate-binding protein [Rhodobacterales bacterium]
MLRKLSCALLMAGSPAMAEAPAVTTDIGAVHSLVAQVMQGVGRPEILLDQGGDAHSFQLRPSQARQLANADLLFWVGPELTPWLQRAVDGIGVKGAEIQLMHAPGAILRDFDGTKALTHEDHDNHAEAAHHHEGLDPHLWLDPQNAIVWLDHIAHELAKADPEHASQYQANATAAKGRIAALMAQTRQRLAPVQNRAIVVSHDAYGYFADRFGLQIAGSIRDGDAASPGAAHLQELQAKIDRAEVVCAFGEVNHEPGLLDTLFEGHDIPVGNLDPSGVSLRYGPELYGDLIANLVQSLLICAK